MSINSVLIPTNDESFSRGYAAGYSAHGVKVTVGKSNFILNAGKSDLLHLLWPEELAGWKPPDNDKLRLIENLLRTHKEQSKVICSVQNLVPHMHPDDPQFRKLYSLIYQSSDLIHHFSHTSLKEVLKLYPDTASQKHVVCVGFNYQDSLVGTGNDRSQTRRNFGLRDDDFVCVVAGNLRNWAEFDLLRKAIKNVAVPRFRILFVGRPPKFTGGRLRFRICRYKLWEFRRLPCVSYQSGFKTDAELADCFRAADAAIVVRKNCLSSGIVSYAMTIGTPVVAPRCGAIPEYLSGTENLLYDPDLPHSLAGAVNQAFALDRERVAQNNRAVASEWTWHRTIAACLNGIDQSVPRSIEGIPLAL